MIPTGTAQRCDCHHQAILAFAKPSQGILEVRDKQHGTHHLKSWTLADLVSILDPKGTSFTAVNGSRSSNGT